MRLDKKGRPRPDGYGMVIDPQEAAIVLSIFHVFAAFSLYLFCTYSPVFDRFCPFYRMQNPRKSAKINNC